MVEKTESAEQGTLALFANDVSRDFRQPKSSDFYQPCPILREAQVYEGQANAGIELCLNCPYKECILDELARRTS